MSAKDQQPAEDTPDTGDLAATDSATDQDARPDTSPAATVDAPHSESTAASDATAGSTGTPVDTQAPAPGTTSPDTSPTTPGRGAHMLGRRTPVAPEPEPEGPPTSPLIAVDQPTTAPTVSTPPEVETPTAAIRRTSFRSELDGPGTPAPDPFSATPPPAPASPPFGTPLHGTGPSDAQVPPGDVTAEAQEPLAPFPFPAVEPVPLRRERGPRRGGIGRMLLGMLIGVLSGAVGIWLVTFGQSRILGAQAPQWDASYDPLGVVLVTLGVLVLAALIGVGAWSTAAPFTAGLLATVIGVVYLYVPATTHADTVSWVATDATLGSVERTVVAATSGTVFALGALLLATGITFAAINRRRFPRA